MLQKACLFFLFFINAFPQLGFTQTVALDSTFSGDGIMMHPVGSINDEIRSIIIQPDGKILAVGLIYTPSPTLLCAMARYMPNGSLDTSFSGDGKLVDTYNQLSCAFNAVALQNDGKIIAAGVARHTVALRDNIALARYHQNGTVDNTFGIGGKVITDYFGHHDNARGVVIQQDGKIVAAGTSIDSSNISIITIERYNTDGTLDTSFNTDGKFSFNYGVGSGCNSLAMQADGKFILAGFASVSPTTGNLAVARINTNGTLDSTFGVNGKQYVLTPFTAVAESVALQPNGKIVVAGIAIKNPPYYEFATMRFLDNGMLDSSFSSDGIEVDSLSPYIDYARALAIQQDGKIIVAGATSSTGLQNDFVMVRYTTDGVRDTTFGINGKLTAILSPGYETIYALQLQSDGKLVAAGFAEVGGQRNFAVIRLTTDLVLGVLDFESAENELLVYPNPIEHEAMLQYELKKTETVSITLMNMQGIVMKTFCKNHQQLAGNYSLPILLGNEIIAGCYLLTISNETGQTSVKLIKR